MQAILDIMHLMLSIKAQEGLAPVTGTFVLRSGSLTTPALNWGAPDVDVQNAVQTSLGALARGATVVADASNPAQGFRYGITFGG